MATPTGGVAESYPDLQETGRIYPEALEDAGRVLLTNLFGAVPYSTGPVPELVAELSKEVRRTFSGAGGSTGPASGPRTRPARTTTGCLIFLTAPSGVRQHLVRLLEFLEPPFGFGVSRVQVRVCSRTSFR